MLLLRRRPPSVTAKIVASLTAAVMLPPFVILAVAPMVLMMIPVAICGIPFLLAAFAPEATDVVAPRYSVRVLRPAVIH
ncbi:MAG TPA: hypothetical protein VHM19_18810 [Polyangiales bacterium]|nr:hypothetical protein [Polyangiales bacterium]